MVLMLDPFQLPFMQRAALEIVLLAPIAGLLGTQIVLRHLAFFTHGIGTATFPGLVLAGPAGIPPALAAIGVGGLFAALLDRIGRRTALAADTATALLLVGALAIGIVLASDVFASGSGVDQLLFGSLLAIGNGELLFTALVGVVVLGGAATFRRAWIASGFDPLGGSTLGLPIARADRILLGLVALAAVAALDAVGALLGSAVLVVPAATARLFAPSVDRLELWGGGLAAAEGLVGLLAAYHLDVPPGATIAVLGGAVFAVALAARELRDRRSPLRTDQAPVSSSASATGATP
jgi:manganese/iron transport system permease protein